MCKFVTEEEKEEKEEKDKTHFYYFRFQIKYRFISSNVKYSLSLGLTGSWSNVYWFEF